MYRRFSKTTTKVAQVTKVNGLQKLREAKRIGFKDQGEKSNGHGSRGR